MNLADPTTSAPGVTSRLDPSAGPNPSMGTSAGANMSANPSQRTAPGTDASSQETHVAADMVSRVAKSAHETIDSIAEHAKPSLERLEQGLSSTGDVLHDKADVWRATGEEWAESLRDTVREHPLAALAAALAVGVVIARITR